MGSPGCMRTFLFYGGEQVRISMPTLAVFCLLAIFGFSACTESSVTSSMPSSDGDQEATCPEGSLGCPCRGDSSCDDGLICSQGTCVSDDNGEDGDSDTQDAEWPTDGDWDAIDGDATDGSDGDEDRVDAEADLDDENGGFEGDAPMDGDQDLDLAETDEGDNTEADGDFNEGEADHSESDADADPDAMDGDPDAEAESELAPECESGPCCQDGRWLEENESCLYGADIYACTSDLCNADHECEHTRLNGFCLIGGACALHHENHPDNSCRWCDAEANQWADKPSTESCNDQENCTFDDHCKDGECTGTPITCEDDADPCGVQRACDGSNACLESYADETTACGDDGYFCTDDHCDGQGECVHERAGDTCLIAGECYEDGEASPADTCQACDSTVNEWTAKEVNAHCEDGNTCTYYDHCQEDGRCETGAYLFACAPQECQESSVCTGWGDCETMNLADDTACGNDGLCTGPNLCQDGVCERTWAVDCKGHGVCIPETGECDCLEGFAGTDCGQCVPDAPGTYPSCAQVTGATPVSPTGQRACYADGYVMPCSDQAGEATCGALDYCGQDAEYPDPPRALRIVSVGNDEVVIDSLTRLWWQRNDIGEDLSWQGAVGYCLNLYHAGYSDWYLPLPRHWITVLDFGLNRAGIDPNIFPQGGGFWTSQSVAEPVAWADDLAWMLSSDGDFGWSHDYNSSINARCVRNWTPNSEYGGDARYRLASFPPDWIVDDLLTGLAWNKAADSSANGLTWIEALSYCESSNAGGFDDWRLPNVKELLSIVDFSRADPASGFPNITTDALWSSTSDPHTPTQAFRVDFSTGAFETGEKSEWFRVRCVR